MNETGGVRFDDPYSGFEADDAPATQAFRAAHRVALDTYLRGTQLAVIRTAIADEIGRLDRAALPLAAGDGFIAHRIDQMTGESQIVAGARSDALDRVLVDTATWPGVAPAIDWLVPSPKGAYAAFSVSERGDEDGAVRVVEIATGRLLDDRVDHVFLAPVAWLPDESGFYVNASLPERATLELGYEYLVKGPIYMGMTDSAGNPIYYDYDDRPDYDATRTTSLAAIRALPDQQSHGLYLKATVQLPRGFEDYGRLQYWNHANYMNSSGDSRQFLLYSGGVLWKY